MKTLRILFSFTKRRKLQTVRPFDIIRLMLKRIMFTLMVLLVIYSGVLVGFRIFEPEQTDAGSESAIATVSLDYETLKEYTRSTGNSKPRAMLIGMDELMQLERSGAFR